jgi:curli biogenesis system outer membrane secretion channel CsgG
MPKIPSLIFRFAAGIALAASPTLAVAEAPILGVLKFQDETGAMALQGGAGRALTTMLTNELAARGSFTVVERQKLRAVLEEQDLAESGRMTPGQGAELGKLLGADYLVTGTVTAFEEQTETRAKGGLFGRGRVEHVSKGGYLAVDLRVIDSTTGQIAWARTIEGRTEASKTEVQTPGASFGFTEDGPGSRAVRAAVIEIIDYLDCVIVQRNTCVDVFAEKERRRIEATRKAATIR